MDANRFDLISRAVASRQTRRQALRTAGGGLAGMAALAAGLRGASAQDATPAAGTPAAVEGSSDSSFLFVQNATGGTFAANPDAGASAGAGTPVPGGGASYLLTLEGHTGNTVYFSDRPARVFGSGSTQQFLDGLGFPAENPPNAALVTADADGNEDVLVVELLAPIYDESAGSVTYGVNILSDYEGGLDFAAARQQDEDLAPSFGAASLFIDDCPSGTVNCYRDDDQGRPTTYIGSIGEKDSCFYWGHMGCGPCDGIWAEWGDECIGAFPDCEDRCEGLME